MDRRTLIIIVGAFAVVGLLLLAWFWLFSKGSITDSLFGRGGNTTATSTATTGGQTNIPGGNAVGGTGSNTSQGGTNVPIGGSTGAPGNQNPFGNVGSVSPAGSGGVAPTGGVDAVPGVEWLGGTGSGGSSGSQTTSFVPSGINQLNDGTTGGQVTILGSGPTAPSVDPEYGKLFAALGIGTAICTAGLLGPGAVGGSAVAANTAALQSLVFGPAPFVTADYGLRQQNVFRGTSEGITAASATSDSFRDNFLSCIARSVGRAIVDQITASVVNWINGGFKGSPSFVQNYQQFFANVADQAVGEYIKGSSLSFLCSPFQLQIKIAIAQSYAKRNQAASCSLTGVTRNIQNFMNGNFSAGGWGSLLSFTTVPTNNPFGAYGYAQIGIVSAQQRALSSANRNITAGGFISFAQTYDCQATVSPSGVVGQNGQLINNSQFLSPTQAAGNICPSNCKCKTATPGSVIENAINSTQSSTLNQLNLAKNFDEIVSALITQLITRTLQQGLSNLSGQNGYESNFLTPDQQAAQTQGNALLTELQVRVTVSQQYGQVHQGSITDLQGAQNQLASLLNCQESRGQTAAATSTAQAILALEQEVALHNNEITRANQSIAALQQLQTQVLDITSVADLARVRQNYESALSSGVIILAEDVTLATQDRTTLQSRLAAQNAQTATAFAQCSQQTP